MTEPFKCEHCNKEIELFFLDDLVNERLEEMNKNAEDFDKELWRWMRRLLDDLDYNWSDEGMVTAQDVYDFLSAEIASLKNRVKDFS